VADGGVLGRNPESISGSPHGHTMCTNDRVYGFRIIPPPRDEPVRAGGHRVFPAANSFARLQAAPDTRRWSQTSRTAEVIAVFPDLV
jgi:hypothetical protein